MFISPESRFDNDSIRRRVHKTLQTAFEHNDDGRMMGFRFEKSTESRRFAFLDRLFWQCAQRQTELNGLIASPDIDRNGATNTQVGRQPGQASRAFNRLSIDFLNDVAGLDSGT